MILPIPLVLVEQTLVVSSAVSLAISQKNVLHTMRRGAHEPESE